MIKNRQAFVTGCVFLLLGYTFYLFVRGFDPLNIFTPVHSNLSASNWFSAWGSQSLPTVLHTAGFSFLTYGLYGKKIRQIAVFWLLINLLFELLQHNSTGHWVAGTYSEIDLMAAFVGYLIFILFAKFTSSTRIFVNYRPNDNASDITIFIRRSFKACLFAFGFISITATNFDLYDCIGCSGSNDAQPIYLSYEELRGPLTVQLDRKLNAAGKIYTYNNFLFISERNKGIHIYDNSDPNNPFSRGFIELPGNLDIAIKDGFLYADSFVDLVVIDLSDPSNPVLTKRIEDVFPYDAYQAIDDSNLIYFYDLDKSQGVVIGYTIDGSKS